MGKKQSGHLSMSHGKCRNCGNAIFMPYGAGIWKYKDGKKLYCTYSCMNQYRSEHPELVKHDIYAFQLRKIRNYFQLTQKQIAVIMGWTNNMVEDAETGWRSLRRDELNFLCRVFGCTAEQMTGLEAPDPEKMVYWEVDWDIIDGSKPGFQSLRSFRLARKTTMQQIATYLGIKYQRYQKYEIGWMTIPDDVIRKMAEYYGCKPDEIPR